MSAADLEAAIRRVNVLAEAAEAWAEEQRGCALDQRDVEQLLRVLREAAAGTLAALAAKGRKG